MQSTPTHKRKETSLDWWWRTCPCLSFPRTAADTQNAHAHTHPELLPPPFSLALFPSNCTEHFVPPQLSSCFSLVSINIPSLAFSLYKYTLLLLLLSILAEGISHPSFQPYRFFVPSRNQPPIGTSLLLLLPSSLASSLPPSPSLSSPSPPLRGRRGRRRDSSSSISSSTGIRTRGRRSTDVGVVARGRRRG